MRAEDWETLSGWLSAWSSADAQERERLRAQLAAEHADLIATADALATASGRLSGFLETPALFLAARDVADDVEPDLLPADSFLGPYRTAGLLARGGMGDVYRAADVRLQRPVALKVVSQARSSDRLRIGRFIQEARMTASLDHPNVIRVYDVGLVDERAYLVTELLEGETLRSRVARGAIPTQEAVRIGLDVARGLAAAHAAGLVHRDLKPENIFLTQSGTTKILDFGIAKLAQDETVRAGTSTLPGVVFGTAGYLAPEQIRGDPVDARADLFSLGAVVFEMLAGIRAFEREHVVETLHAILHDGPPDVLDDRPDVPPALAKIVARLLEKSADARFQSTADLISVLEDVGVTRHDPVVGPKAAARKPGQVTHRSGHSGARARPVRTTAAAIAGVLLASVAIGWWAQREPRTSSAEPPLVVLAVMPFRSIPAANDGLDLGLADVLISRLSRLSEIRVLPLTATERLRGEDDPGEVGRRLRATHVLSGGLQRENGFVRATVQLVSTSDNRTIWSSPVDTDTSTLFAIQDIVVTRVLEELAPQLTPGGRRALAQAGTSHNGAYEAYVRARAQAANPTRAALTSAAELLERAVTLDPAYADAWAALGTVSRMFPLFDGLPVEGFVKAQRAARRALQLDAANAEAHSVLGTVAFWHDWDYREAERLLRLAVDLQPSSTQSYLSLAHLLSNVGRHDEALVEIRRARTLDEGPLLRALEGQFLFMARRDEDSLARLNEVIALEPRLAAGHVMRAYPLMALNRYQDAILSCDKALELHRNLAGSGRPHSFTLALRGYALARMGRTADAELVLAQLRAQAREQYVPPHHEALLLHALGQREPALARLRDAVDTRDMFVTFVGVDSKWDELRDLPEFRNLMSRANLLAVSDGARR